LQIYTTSYNHISGTLIYYTVIDLYKTAPKTIVGVTFINITMSSLDVVLCS
jgi:hypothetical protein